MENKILVEMLQITKCFGQKIANNHVDFSVREGEIHALLGENGAGKSTLMNMLYGLYSKDSGTIIWKGKDVNISSPAEAIKLGIGMIHQHFQLVEKFTVLENVVLGLKEGNWINLPMKEAEKRVMEISDTYRLNIKPHTLVENLTVGEQQRVEIVKALYRKSELLIMDEPTAVLTPQEVDNLFLVLTKLKEEGKSVIFISHKLPEVLQICDRISIMRDGQMIKMISNEKGLDSRTLANHMVGREISLKLDKKVCVPGEVVLKVDNVYADSVSESCGVNGISFELRRGEILGIAGVDGNGQTDLSELIMGLRKLRKGSVTFLGKDISGYSTKKIRDLPVGYIPADRLHTGLVMNFSLQQNMIINKPDQAPFGNKIFMNLKAITDYTEKKLKEFKVSAPGPNELAKNLSGGNQQKVVLAREVCSEVELIIAVYPTRGLDIDATRFVFNIMLEARDRGAAVLYISTELEEILEISDRIGVLYEGELRSIIPGKNADVSKIGLLMAGESVNISGSGGSAA